MNISSKEFLDTLPTTFTQGKKRPADLMVYARLVHPELPQDYYVTHYDEELEGFRTITKYKGKGISMYSYISIESLLTANSEPYHIDKDFVPVRITDLLADLKKRKR